MLENVEVLYHSSIRINGNIYFDPYGINERYNNAKIIFITHGHYDHLSLEDIEKVYNENTIFVCPSDVKEELIKFGINSENIILAEPDKSYSVDNVKFSTVRAYNIDKAFHPKSNNWLGYVVNVESVHYYIAGDTDETEDNLKVKCDVAMVPVGGTYTMDFKEAASFVNKIKPKIAIPTHYNSIVGNSEDGRKFKELLDSNIECKLYL